MSPRASAMAGGSKVIKYENGEWRNVPVRAYKQESTRHRDVSRHELIGANADEQALDVVVRYFEIAPGGYSSLEHHEHPHAVMIVRGSGSVILGESQSEVGPLDCVYVAPGTLHQFQASDQEPLGFVCIVDRLRDRAVTPSRAEIEALVARGLRVKPKSLEEE